VVVQQYQADPANGPGKSNQCDNYKIAATIEQKLQACCPGDCRW
jgi:hypothetical protein